MGTKEWWGIAREPMYLGYFMTTVFHAADTHTHTHTTAFGHGHICTYTATNETSLVLYHDGVETPVYQGTTKLAEYKRAQSGSTNCTVPTCLLVLATSPHSLVLQAHHPRLAYEYASV